MGKLEKRAILLSMLAALFGIMCSYWLNDWGHFARSGSIITVIAIIFASLDLRERLQKADSFVEQQLQIARPGIIQQARNNGLPQSGVDSSVEQFESDIRNEVRDAMDKASKRLLRVEIALFGIGTLIWGYGDITAKFFLPTHSG